MQFKEGLNEKMIYYGTIRKCEVKKEKFLTFVELDDEPNILYLNSQQISMRVGSPFHHFCDGMKLIEENGELDFDILIDVSVIVKFKKGRDGNMYISMLDKVESDENEEVESDE